LSFEALLRWTHPVHGPVAPSDFIPLAETAGLIADIGEWVLAEACRECRNWQREGRPAVTVGVNVSAVQFEMPGFPRRVIEILHECGLDPALLTLELTEGILVRDLPFAARQLAVLRAAGIRISLDDFGTGYSSLSYLASLSVDTIKLDRSFLNRDFAGDSAIIRSVITMAHGIGLRVVAEGVETHQQRDRLKDLNCDELQGFYYSRPMPADAVSVFLDSREAEPAAVRELVLA
jgi:EAL domain-containing protein (putative c-di-GMP-specific phosphodiesterase class I)